MGANESNTRWVLQNQSRLGKILVVTSGLAVWELLAGQGLINPYLFPPPSALWHEVRESPLFDAFALPYAQQSSQFFIVNSVVGTVGRVLAGLSLGFVAGAVTGFAMLYSATAQRIILPLISLLAPISPIAWIPVAMVLLGIGNAPAIAVVTISVYFLVAVATVGTAKNVDQRRLTWLAQFGASRYEVLRHVIIPEVLPSLFLILRLNLFAAWMSVLAAEMVGVAQGLGAMVMVGRALFNMKIVLIAMLLIGVCGYAMDRIVLGIQRLVTPWQKEAALPNVLP